MRVTKLEKYKINARDALRVHAEIPRTPRAEENASLEILGRDKPESLPAGPNVSLPEQPGSADRFPSPEEPL